MGRRHRAGRFLILRGCTSAYIPLFVQEEAPEALPLDSGRALPCTRKGVPPLTLSRDSVGDTFKLCPRVNAEISPLRRRPEGFAVALWTASRPHLSLLSAIATFLVGVPFVPYAALSTNKHETPKVAAPKVSKGRSQASPVFIALWSPPQRRNPCKQKAILGEKSVFSPILRLHQHHRPQNAILIRVQTQRRIAPPRIIIRLPRA